MEQSRMSVERKWEERIERKKERKIEEPGAAFCDMQSSASNHNHGDPAAVMRARVDRKSQRVGFQCICAIPGLSVGLAGLSSRCRQSRPL